MTRIGDDLLSETLTEQLPLGGSVHHIEKTRRPEDLAVPAAAIIPRANGEQITGTQWMVERTEMRGSLAAKGCKDGKGNVVHNRTSLHVILAEHPYWRGAIRFNELLSIVECAGERVDGTFVTRVIEWFETQWGHHRVKKAEVLDAVDYVARLQRYHPVRHYLTTLPPWDGVARIEDLVDVLHAEPKEDRDLYSAYLRAFFVGAVTRALEPGEKFDTMLVLLGAQGARKSTFWRVLAGEPPFYNELPSTKWDDIYAIHGAWIHEYAELESVTTRADVGRIKGHLSTLTDSGALKYERQVTYLRRGCVFVGTTNEADALLRDPTGNRRFHIIRVGNIDIDYVRQHRDQLWAEAIAMRNSGERQWLTDPELVAAQASATEQYVIEDPWKEAIETYVTRNFLVPIRIADILDELGVDKDRRTKQDQMRVASILRELRFEKDQDRVSGKNSKVWVRIR